MSSEVSVGQCRGQQSRAQLNLERFEYILDVKLGSEELIVSGCVLFCFCRQRSKTKGDKLSSYIQD